MNHPRDIQTPEGVRNTGIGDKEDKNEMYEYVEFTADMTVADASTVENFVDELRENFSGWEIAGGHGAQAEKQKIELRKVYHDKTNEPSVPDEILEKQREKEAEYYKKD